MRMMVATSRLGDGFTAGKPRAVGSDGTRTWRRGRQNLRCAPDGPALVDEPAETLRRNRHSRIPCWSELVGRADLNLADRLVEHVNVHRLREVTTEATGFGALSVDFLRVAGNGDERHSMQTAVDPQPLRELEAVHHRQPEIE